MVASRCAQLCVLDCQRSSEIFGVVVYGKMRSEDRIYLRVYEILSVPCPVSCSRLNLLKMEDGRRERGEGYTFHDDYFVVYIHLLLSIACTNR